MWVEKKTHYDKILNKRVRWYSQPWLNPKKLTKVFNDLCEIENSGNGQIMFETPKLFFFCLIYKK